MNVAMERSAKPVEAITPQESEQLSSSLRSALESIGLSPSTLGIGLLSVATLFTAGCSPQSKSYWTGAYTKLPDPPASARLVLNTSTEDDGTVFINYVEWNQKTSEFIRRDTHYSTKGIIGNYGNFSELGGYEQRIRDGEVLVNGAIIDQKEKRIDLGDGRYVDGPTGNIIDSSGKIMKELNTK